ncbi:MAG: hypothetical protein ABSG22_00955 [Sedimentisphaerales bacterium]|jgi:hypothetical protein
MRENQRNILDNTVPTKKCFVAFLDILGFKSKVIESQDSADKLRILIDSLKICGRFSLGGKNAGKIPGPLRTIDIRSRVFSDTIVFFLQTNEENIAQLFLVIRYLQDRLWERGICLRGAITIGDMYWPNVNNDITVGLGLIEAYELETEVAIYPRIIVSEKLFSYINSKEIRSYPFGQRGELKDFIRRDEDGVRFLDLLNKDITRIRGETLRRPDDGNYSIIWTEGNGSKHQEILKTVKDIVRNNRRSKDIKKQQKYNWLNSYLGKIEGEL